ncbi:hypothetical protein CCR75_007176 [Bremia lactucae]|uniref:Uncharacterized protein n=1 Tax=Bremia lactucae TaxID=4779 RepID=A0A976FQ07_BRELC|nr:hypothetical protein CCR75_007176 [Bremia lactucae]
MSNKQASSSFYKAPNRQPYFAETAVFPPLPRLPPPDVFHETESTRKAPSACIARPRRFGTKITNLQNARDVDSFVLKIENKLPPSIASNGPQRYSHTKQPLSPLIKQPSAAENTPVGNHEKTPVLSAKKKTIALQENAENSCLQIPGRDHQSRKLPDWSPIKPPLQPGRSIWSIDPDELSELELEMAAITKDLADSAQKVTYAEASKCALPGCGGRRASQPQVKENLPRSYKRYYGLPIIPSYAPFCSWESQSTPMAEDKNVVLLSSNIKKKHSNATNRDKTLGLSADTPTFFPRQSTEMNEILQLVTLASKKIAPHMDWWPTNPCEFVLMNEIWITGGLEMYKLRTFLTETRASDAELADKKMLVLCTHQTQSARPFSLQRSVADAAAPVAPADI